jgi:peroxiredoxin
MTTIATRRVVQVGDPAPAFSLPAVHRDGSVGLDDYRGKSGLLIGMIRGIYCSYCRRQMVQLAEIADALRSVSVEILVVVTTPVQRARVYAEFYPTTLPLASDPDMTTYQAFGLPRPKIIASGGTDWPLTVNPVDIEQVVPVYTAGEISQSVSLGEAARRMNAKDGFELSEDDLREKDATWNQLSGLVLIDMHGIVRWVDVEAPGGFADWGHIASNPQIVAAAQRLTA